MLELLKNLGIPSAAAVLIAALIVFIPLALKIDDRYAKDAEMNTHLEVLDKQIVTLTDEIGKLNGTAQVLVAVITANSRSVQTSQLHGETRTPKIVGKSVTTVAIPESDEQKKFLLDSVSKGLVVSQQRLQAIQKESKK